jgi:alpha-galactosidase
VSITYDKGVFALDTDRTSYIFRVTKFRHLEHIHYGERVRASDAEALSVKHDIQLGSSVMYDESDDCYCLDNLCLEWSGVGRGDYRQTPIEAKMPDGSFSSDFLYDSHEIVRGCLPMHSLPAAYDDENAAQTLIIRMRERDRAVTLELYYTVFPASNVISRRCVIENNCEGDISLRRIMSMSLDMPDRGFLMHSFDGGWIKEAHRHVRPVEYGIYVNSSTTGASSNRHNPGFLLSEKNTGEDFGRAWGFNLVYSGNHCGVAERSNHDLVRIQLGINPHCFDWTVRPGERFEAPEAVMTFSERGFNGLSANFHDFVNNNIVRGIWKNVERPVLINNWEACFFKFDREKLLKLARRAKSIGVELFVLDDGWFGARDSDTAGLGDYDVNLKKLPGGLGEFAGSIEKLGMKFGLWFEPESVNVDSGLYRAHPDWAIKPPTGKPCFGRNQLLLDLTRQEVRDYIVESVGRTLDGARISYVKWDMNRHMSDAYSPLLSNQGEFSHRYIMGLYEVLGRIFTPRPHILLESCSSGGNRFDLGMLCYSPQIWASDDTDPIERLDIQGGLSYLYPQSTMGAHVSAAPHQQTLRDTPLSTRFNVAAFGVLGYELELKYMTKAELKELRGQIAFYKKHRKMLQYGRFYRFDEHKANKLHWQVSSKDGKEHVVGCFQKLCTASEGYDMLSVHGLEPSARYHLVCKRQSLFIKRLGGLVKHVMPLELDPDGFVLRTANKFFTMPDGAEDFFASGAALMSGVGLNNQFLGTGYNERLHMLGDFGSALYTIKKEK